MVVIILIDKMIGLDTPIVASVSLVGGYLIHTVNFKKAEKNKTL
jgi:hypothetical protein